MAKRNERLVIVSVCLLHILVQHPYLLVAHLDSQNSQMLPHIQNNLVSTSKLTFDNHVYVEFSLNFLSCEGQNIRGGAATQEA